MILTGSFRNSSCLLSMSFFINFIERTYYYSILFIITACVPNNEAINYLGPSLLSCHSLPIQSLDIANDGRVLGISQSLYGQYDIFRMY